MSTVSRAYHAAFNVAAEFYQRLVTMPSDAKGHRLAYYYLNNCEDESLIEVGGDLDDLRGIRNDADYDMNQKRVEKEVNVQNWVDVADEIIKTLDECNKRPRSASRRRSRSRQGIQEENRFMSCTTISYECAL